MKVYGIKKNELEKIRSILASFLQKNPKTKVYLFGSRANNKFKKYSDVDLLIESNSKDIQRDISKIKDALEESDLPYQFDIIHQSKVIPEYQKQINRQKVLFWRPEQDKKTNSWRVCPAGEHWVKRHLRQTRSAKISEVDGHCRKNPSGKELITTDEIRAISELDIFKSQSTLPSNKNLGFKNGNKFDSLIAGWTAFWNDTFKSKVKTPLDPNLVKALIASESGFNVTSEVKNKLKNIGKAKGLVQLTQQTSKILRNQKGELKDYLLILNKDDIFDPNVNIAAAIRWLFRKHETAKVKLKREPSWEEVLWEYKGITLQKNKRALKIKDDLKQYIERLK